MCTGRAGPPGTRPSTSCCSTVAIQRPGCRLSRTRWVRLHCPGAHIGAAQCHDVYAAQFPEQQ